MAEGQRAGIGGVGRSGRGGQAEAGLDHPLHLLLGGRPPPGDGVLDLVGRVLGDLAPGRRRLGQRQPAGLPDAHRRAHVDLEEDVLDGHGVRLVLSDQVGQLPAEGGQTLGQRVRGGVRITPIATAVARSAPRPSTTA